jgi:hypothetical protein
MCSHNVFCLTMKRIYREIIWQCVTSPEVETQAPYITSLHASSDLQCIRQAQGPTNHNKNPPSAQHISEMVTVVLHTYLAPPWYVHIHKMEFLFRNKANLKPETLIRGLLCKASEGCFLSKCSHLTQISSSFSSASTWHFDCSPCCLFIYFLINWMGALSV